MLDVAAIERLDPVIHERARLKIMTLLAPTDSLSFKELKEHLRMTDGNLCVHMRTLEESGYVSVRKSFVNRKPRTEYALTPEGRGAFVEYIQTLEQIVKQSQPAEQTEPAPGAPGPGPTPFVGGRSVGGRSVGPGSHTVPAASPARDVRPVLQQGMAPAK